MLTNFVSATVYDFISDSTSYEAAQEKHYRKYM